jgi:GTP-binding protein LepA
LPLNEIVLDFYDRLKSVSRAAMRRSTISWRGTGTSPMVKLDIMVSGEPVDALSIIMHRDFAYDRGRALVSEDEAS